MTGKTKPGMPAPRGGRDLLGQAQEMIYDAWEIDAPIKRAALARKALKISPDCADAYVLLAEAATAPAKVLEFYRKAVAAGERALGRQTFEDEGGHFWGLLETRPYMRARAGLALSLWARGQHDEAIAHWRAMLILNPNDNQGIRYILASCLLELGRDEQVAGLLSAYPDDAAAAWPWSRGLLVFRQQGDCSDSRGKLDTAIEINPHVPAYLLGCKKLPRRLPDSVGFGDDSEAVCYAAENLKAWRATNGALAWLAARTNSEKPKLLN
jgi:tetratricopeptide (TPR) repeat protein